MVFVVVEIDQDQVGFVFVQVQLWGQVLVYVGDWGEVGDDQ